MTYDLEWPNRKNIRIYLRRDLQANRRDPKSQIILILLRLCQLAMGSPERVRPVAFPLIAAYRVITEFILGLEVRPKTRVGPGLTIFHGYGLVLNDHCVIGQDVVLRNGVTIGSKIDGGPVPIVGDRVQVGAGAIVLGGITIGADSKIGAGAVVLRSFPAGSTIVGNPAHALTGPEDAAPESRSATPVDASEADSVGTSPATETWRREI